MSGEKATGLRESLLSSDEPACSIERALLLVGERWTLLILREVFLDRHRYSDMRDHLRIAPNLLSARLTKLVEAGVLELRDYREAGQRPRAEYHLTAIGRELRVVLSALQQWGDDNVPRPAGPSVLRRSAETGGAVRVAYVDDSHREILSDQVLADSTDVTGTINQAG